MRRPLFISIIIPVPPRKEVKEIKFLEKLKQINYPLDKLEVIIVEGTKPSFQRNEGVKIAKGEIIYFLDDDSEPEKNIFERVIEHYNNKIIAGVGGPSLPHPDESFWQRCFSSALSSPFGGFNIGARYTSKGNIREAKENELILCNFSIRRDIYLKVGGLNERLYPNEENEFFNRLNEKGYKLLYDPFLKIYRFSRKNLKEFSRQIFRYGRGRMEHFILQPKYFNPVYLIPLIFCLYIFMTLFLCFFKVCHLFLIPLLVYMVLSLYFSIQVTLDKKLGIKGFIIMPLVFLVLHFSYGLGLIYGIYSGIKLRFKKQEEIPPVKVRRVGVSL